MYHQVSFITSHTIDICNEVSGSNFFVYAFHPLFDVFFIIIDRGMVLRGDESMVAILTPSGYATRSFPRTKRRGGGIAIVLKKEIKATTEFEMLPFSSFECVKLLLNEKTNVCIISPTS